MSFPHRRESRPEISKNFTENLTALPAEEGCTVFRSKENRIAAIPGVKVTFSETPHFTEFVVNFDDTHRTAAGINQALLEKDIFGGKDLSQEFPELGQSLLFCVSEVHSRADLDRLAAALKEVLQ